MVASSSEIGIQRQEAHRANLVRLKILRQRQNFIPAAQPESMHHVIARQNTSSHKLCIYKSPLPRPPDSTSICAGKSLLISSSGVCSPLKLSDDFPNFISPLNLQRAKRPERKPLPNGIIRNADCASARPLEPRTYL